MNNDMLPIGTTVHINPEDIKWDVKGDLISREALKKQFKELHLHPDLIELIDNAPTVNPCDNCDLYFIAKTKEEMRKGGAE